MKFGKLLKQKLSRGMFYHINAGEVMENPDFVKALHLANTQRRLRKAYYTDPNDMDPADVADIFSDVLKSLTIYKESQVRAV